MLLPLILVYSTVVSSLIEERFHQFDLHNLCGFLWGSFRTRESKKINSFVNCILGWIKFLHTRSTGAHSSVYQNVHSYTFVYLLRSHNVAIKRSCLVHDKPIIFNTDMQFNDFIHELLSNLFSEFIFVINASHNLLPEATMALLVGLLSAHNPN